MEAKHTGLRVLMFPWLAYGHVFPYLELAKRLTKRNFKVYLCSTSINVDYIRVDFKKACDDDLSIELVELQLPSLPELPPQYHTTKNLPPHLMPTLIQAFQKSSPNFANIITTLKPDLLIYDGFQPWAAKAASSQGIPAVHFATSGSTTLSFYHHLYTHKSSGTFPHPSIYLRDYELKDIIAQGASIKLEDFGEGFVFGTFDLSREIVLIKGCRGIEGKYIDYLSTLCMKRVLPVGPLVTRNDESNIDSEMFISWLSTKPRNSTLFISFGSENYFSKSQIQEIAKGLELTNVNFIWTARFPIGSEIKIGDVLPEGFLDRVKDRGLFVQKWAPQAAILENPSVGGFMSHCGWSSIMESIYFAVPVVALPLKLDQPVNCRLVVEAGVGVEVTRGGNGEVYGEEVAKAVNKVIVEESGEGLRCRMRELSEKMKIEEEEALCEVAQELSSICMKHNKNRSAF